MKRLISFVLAIVMLMTVYPFAVSASATAPAASVTTNSNQNEGVVLYKSAVPHLGSDGEPDGTIDISIEAYTTGVVTNSTKVTPADIVLVLDTSGSMEKGASSETKYVATMGKKITQQNNTSYYGFESGTYYVYVNNTYVNAYVNVSNAGTDTNGFQYYSYRVGTRTTYVYPILESEPANANRKNNYSVVRFYTAEQVQTSKSRIELLDEGVKAFIDETLAANASVQNEADKHSIAIVKFADDSYYSGKSSTQEIDKAVVGNNTDGNGYNYSQVVAPLTIVDAVGAADLKADMDALSPGGATSVDYGLSLAEKLLKDAKNANPNYSKNQVVVVFTDGEPNHQSGYDQSVAALCINKAKALKDIGVKIFSICVDDNADASAAIPADGSGNANKNINKFMHYLSSNFPLATVGNNNILNDGVDNTAEVAAAMALGYYQTPDSNMGLGAIFKGIAQSIGTPTIKIGEGATLLDTIHPYFTLPDGTNGISVQTSAKTADGWAAPVSVPGLTLNVQNRRTISVTGFDFDANYISETARDGFYGKKLILTFNIVPDYAVLDAAGDLGDGMLPTNQGNASLNDSSMKAVAETASPELKAYRVIYKADGAVYKTVYRFAGANVDLIDEPADTAALDYGSWTSTDVTIANDGFKMPAKDVEINVTSTRVEYKVTYRYSDPHNVPAGAPAVPGTDYAEASFANGTTVQVKQDISLTGYEFSGWQTVNVTVTNGEFTMPTHDVEFVGSFSAGTVAYTVEHYLQNEDGSWPTTASHVHTHEGTTGATVEVHYDIVYPHFTLAADNEKIEVAAGKFVQNIPTGTVLANSSLVLKLYYKRNQYEVSYELLNNPDASNVRVPATVSYYYGADVTVAPVPYIDGYTFEGWSTDSNGAYIQNGEHSRHFTMPGNDVVLKGAFVANSNTRYEVRHFLENAGGNGYTLAHNEPHYHTGITGSTAYAIALNFPNYSHVVIEGKSKESGTIKGDGSLVLEVYYARVPYTVSYKITGAVLPEGYAKFVPTDQEIDWGDTAQVKVANVIDIPGYVFYGWYTDDVVPDADGKFTMPTYNVEFVGYFARETAVYTVEHYLMDTEGNYPTTPTETYEKSGNVDDLAEAAYITTFVNVVPDKDYADTVLSNKKIISNKGGSQLVLRLYYKRLTNTVKYVYTDTNGEKIEYTDSTSYYVGSTVTVDAVPERDGYTFNGWISANVSISDGAFTMPKEPSPVVLTGSFTAQDGIVYHVEHWVEVGEAANGGKYELRITTSHTGTTDEYVEATAEVFHGYKRTVGHINEVPDGYVQGDGSLVLKLYYDRIQYNVSYVIDGDVKPANIDEQIPKNQAYEWGTLVDVHNGEFSNITGYIFSGWKTTGADVGGNNKFLMPSSDVRFTGKFTVHTAEYKVEHYLQNADGTWPTTASHVHTHEGTTGATVEVHYDIAYPHFTLVKNGVDIEVAKGKFVQNVPTGTVLADGTLVLKLYYTRDKYSVTYVYLNESVPAGAPALPETQSYYYNQRVDLANVPTLAGYSFLGWATDNADVIVQEDAGVKYIIMPNRNVLITGAFLADTDTPYTVEHYLQVSGSEYVLDAAATEYKTGTTGEIAYALPKSYPGYKHNPEHENKLESEKIKNDGSLVLKVYYDKVPYTVSYSIVGDKPEGYNAEHLPGAEIKYYNDDVEVKGYTNFDGYRFVGWDTTDAVIAGGKFTMPAQNVSLSGYYEKTIAGYKVEHYLMNTDGETYTLDQSYVIFGNIGAEVSASPLSYEGFTFDATNKSNVSGTVNAEGTLVLRLYYSRNKYKVAYQYTSDYKNQPVLPEAEEYYFKEEVRYRGVVAMTGYTFSGWTTEDVKVVNNAFDMPANDVLITGYFIPDPSKYTVEHYKMDLNGEYGQIPDATETFTENVKVDDYVVAQFQSFEGFTPDMEKTGDYTGTVTPVPDTLTIRLYYKRNAYNVNYIYYGEQPEGAPDIAVNNLQHVMYGTEVAIAKKPVLEDYVFDGWNATNVNLSGETFVMPAGDVTLYGTFVLAKATYRVEHYLQNTDGTWSETTERFEIIKGEIGKTVTAEYEEFAHFTPVEHDNTLLSGVVDEAGTLVLKLYYERSTFEVRYYVDNELYESFAVPYDAVHTIIGKPVYPSPILFIGWSDPVIADTKVTVPAENGTFRMPAADVCLYGETYVDIPSIDGGTSGITIEKILDAPTGFSVDMFNFAIYRESNGKEVFVKRISVKADGKASVILQPGTYYVYEEDAEVDGYTLFTTTNVVGGKVVVKPGRVSGITFTNSYYLNMLEREDHFGYVIGYPDGFVRPAANITRAEVATIFFRMLTDEARAEYWSTTNSFTDVSADDWFNNAVSTLAKAGVLSGYPDGSFRPNEYITRAELVKIAVSFFGTAAGQSTHFADASDHWAAEFVAAAEAFGFIDGYEDGTFRPDRYVTRAEAMKIINRTLGRNPHKEQLLPDMITWPDNTIDKWYYADVQEATNSHIYHWDSNGYEVWERILPVRDWAAFEKKWSTAYSD